MPLSLKNVFKQLSFFSLSSIIPKALGIVLLPLYCRFLSPSDYGILALAGAMGSIIGIVLPLGTQGAVNRFYFDYEKDRMKDLIGSLVLCLIMLIGVVLIIGSLIGPRAISFIKGARGFDFFLFFFPQILIAGFAAIEFYPTALMQARLQSLRYSYYYIGKFLIATIIIIILVTGFKAKALGVIWGNVGAGFICFLFALYLCFPDMRWPRDWSPLKEALLFGLPLVPQTIFGFINQWFDRIVVGQYRPLSELGLYSMGYTIGYVMYIFSQAFGRTWSPIFFNQMNQNGDKKEIASVATVIVFVFCALTLATALFAKEALILLTTPKYYDAARFVPVIALSYFFNALYMFPCGGLWYVKKIKIFPIATGIAAGLNIALNYLLVPHWGAMGSAYATLVSFAVILVIVFIKAQKECQLPYEKGKLFLIILAGALAYGIGSVLFNNVIIISIFVKIGAMAMFGAICIAGGIVDPRRLLVHLKGTHVS